MLMILHVLKWKPDIFQNNNMITYIPGWIPDGANTTKSELATFQFKMPFKADKA